MPAWALTNGVCMSIIKRQPSGDCGSKCVLRLAELAYWSEKPEAKAPQKPRILAVVQIPGSRWY